MPMVTGNRLPCQDVYNFITITKPMNTSQLKPLGLTLLILLLGCTNKSTVWQWETVQAEGEPIARHEAGLVGYKNSLILIGGRRVNETSVFDIATKKWENKAPTPIEIHHFQPIVIEDAVYIIGAMTGEWPNETPLDKVLIYYPETDTYEFSHDIPTHRQRGGAGLVYYQNKFYLIGGITNGHMNGYVNWLDEYDPKTGKWRTLADAPSNRDHFQAAVLNNKLYCFAGRNTSKITGQDMSLTVNYGDVFNFETEQWETTTTNFAIPTQRAGNAAFVWNNQIIIGGGESEAHVVAHNEVEAFNTEIGTWDNWPSMQEGRHGTGYAIINDHVYTASGSGNRGGGPELLTIERLKLPKKAKKISQELVNNKAVYKQWHTIELLFEGPETSETRTDNPFLNFQLQVTFTNGNTKRTIRGFYAADGNASETSASSGNKWKVRFSPDSIGKWSYTASLKQAENIAISDFNKGEDVSISNSKGSFVVSRSDKEFPDFRANGKLIANNGYFIFDKNGKRWIKGGANSPENLLAYIDFDGTYRIKTQTREGEAAAPAQIHKYLPHLSDWKTGDPIWKNGKGKSLVGAINYLASKGMNSSYFLVLNILGDGNDVWPYLNPDDFTRFDVSKLEQWEIIFRHMQEKGILLHIVTQETENELMLDKGETGPMRKLFYNELIARFGHHNGLVWNLGEENGPAPWSPNGQNTEQRKAMASYLKQNDPYNHPVLLHTHSYDPLRSEIIDSLLGFKDIDGLSLQVDKRETSPNVVEKIKTQSALTKQPWLVTMDEIGMWHTAALLDSEDPDHDSLRRYALWGTLMSGAAGVEWYFGAKHPHNDLTSEDWRQRNNLWEQTKKALDFYTHYLPYWEMSPSRTTITKNIGFSFAKEGEIYALYILNNQPCKIDLTGKKGDFRVQWFDPIQGGSLQLGTKKSIKGNGIRSIGFPPKQGKKDWVALIELITQ